MRTGKRPLLFRTASSDLESTVLQPSGRDPLLLWLCDGLTGRRNDER